MTDKEIFNMIIQKIDAMEGMIDSLQKQVEENNRLYDNLIEPIREASDNYDRMAFEDRYGDRLSEYEDKYDSLKNPDEPSLTDTIYNSARERGIDNYEDMDGLVDSVLSELDQQFDKIRKQFGLSPDTTITVEDKGDGEPEIKADGEPLDVANKEPIATVPAEEVEGESKTELTKDDLGGLGEEEVEEEEVVKDNGETEEDVIKELENYKKKYKRPNE